MEILRKILVPLVLLSLLPGPTPMARAESEQAQLEREQRENQRMMSDAQRELDRIDNELKQLRARSRSNDALLKAAQLELRKAIEQVKIQQGRVQAAKNEVRKLSGEINVTTRSIEKSRSYLDRRAKALLKLSLNQNLEFLLTAADATDLEMRMKLLNSVAQADAALIQETISKKNELVGLRTDKEAVLKKLVAEERQLTAARNNVDRRRRELQQLQNRLQQQTASAEQSRRNVQKQMSQIRAQLARIRERLSQLERVFTAPRTFRKPASGKYYRPEGITLPGIYIRAALGSTVTPIAEGEVLSIQEMHGMGQTVIVGHGGKITSVYANLSSVSVKKGQRVTTKTEIGKSGSSPYGEMMYFAVYRDGVAQDPMDFLN